MALHSFYMKNPSAIPDVKKLAKTAACDNDPGVVSSSLQVFYELMKVNVYIVYSTKGTCTCASPLCMLD